MSNSRRVVIDDTDGGIHYVGPWFLDQDGTLNNKGNFGPPYLNTVHRTNENASLSYVFSGSSVIVWGSNNIANNSGVLTPTWSCYIDKIKLPDEKPFSFFENNWILCQQDALVDEPHILTVNVSTPSQAFYFDKIEYTPSSDTSLSSEIVKVDYLDPGIVLGAGWTSLEDTANMTTLAGSQATFDFIGESVSWVGFIPAELPHDASSASYSIDDGVEPQFPSVFQAFFTTTPDLPMGPHRLKVIYLGSKNQTPLTLTHLFVTNGSFSSSPSDPTAQEPLQSGSLQSGSPQSESPQSGSPQSRSPSRHTKTGIIAGAVLGFVFLLLALVTIFLWVLRRRRNPELTRQMRESINGIGYSAIPNPFMAYLQQTRMASAPVETGTSSASSESSPSSASRNKGYLGSSVAGTSVVPSSVGSRSTREVVHREDSGMRILSQVEEDPPSYSEH